MALRMRLYKYALLLLSALVAKQCLVWENAERKVLQMTCKKRSSLGSRGLGSSYPALEKKGDDLHVLKIMVVCVNMHVSTFCIAVSLAGD